MTPGSARPENSGSVPPSLHPGSPIFQGHVLENCLLPVLFLSLLAPPPFSSFSLIHLNHLRASCLLGTGGVPSTGCDRILSSEQSSSGGTEVLARKGHTAVVRGKSKARARAPNSSVASGLPVSCRTP